jgi:hypothetical protein
LLLGSHCDKEVVDKDHLNNHYLREDAWGMETCGTFIIHGIFQYHSCYLLHQYHRYKKP